MQGRNHENLFFKNEVVTLSVFVSFIGWISQISAYIILIRFAQLSRIFFYIYSSISLRSSFSLF